MPGNTFESKLQIQPFFKKFLELNAHHPALSKDCSVLFHIEAEMVFKFFFYNNKSLAEHGAHFRSADLEGVT